MSSERDARRRLSEAELLDALRRTEAGFREYIDRCPDAVFVRRGTAMLHVNDALVGMLGYSRDELLGKDPVAVFVHPDHCADVLDHRARRGDDTDLREHTWIRKDGELVAVEIVGVTVTFEGAPARIVMSRNVTERNRMQARLAFADHMASVGTLAAGIAHEINNPLACVTANLRVIAESLRGGGPDPAELTEVLADAIDGAERVRRIVAGLRIFARSDRERRERLDLSRVVATALELAAVEIRDRARLVTDLREVARVEADEGQLVQVAVQLLVNAAQAIPAGRPGENEIRVETRTHESGRILLAVHDTGCGIPPERLPRIFDPFFTTKRVGTAPGLGLSLAHAIVTALDGEIAVQSQVGVGTTVTVLLPPAAT